MTVPKNKPITSNSAPSMREQPSPQLPQQQEFQQHLRTLARSAVRVVNEEVMREEVTQFLRVGWGECNPKRKGKRLGSYTRESSDIDWTA